MGGRGENKIKTGFHLSICFVFSSTSICKETPVRESKSKGKVCMYTRGKRFLHIHIQDIRCTTTKKDLQVRSASKLHYIDNFSMSDQ